MNTIPAILSGLDIAEVISRTVKLRKAGSNFVGLCPFHQEKTPSFSVCPDQQYFHCFGCGAGRDVIDFIRLHKGYPDSKEGRRQAINDCAAMAGVTVADFNPRAILRKGPTDTFASIEEKALGITFDPPGVVPQEFLDWIDSRGIDRNVSLSLVHSGHIAFIRGLMCFVYSNGVKLRDDYASSKSSRWIEGQASDSIWMQQNLQGFQARVVIICEGESDSMMTLSCLAEACSYPGVRIKPWEIAVIGAPQASWRPNQAALALIQALGRDVIAVFDNDFAGVDAEEELREAFSKGIGDSSFQTWPWHFYPGVNDLCKLGRKKVAKTLALVLLGL